jgi:hypothetical protein
LLGALEQTQKDLKNKAKETNWLRYTFRRIPLYAASGFIFFAVCLAMAMVEQIGFKVVDQFLKQPTSLDFNWREYTLIISFLLLQLLAFFTGKKFTDKKIDGLGLFVRLLTTILLLAILLSVFSVVITSQYPLQLGLASFSVVLLSAMLTERSLGFTRRNERYQFFAARAEGLQTLFASRKMLDIKFCEAHLLELAKFYEELQQSKFKDTLSDSHYLLTQLEQFKAASS